MADPKQIHSSEPYRPEEFDELQRGEESPLTVEAIERVPVPHPEERRSVPVPDPGERPGAIRIENGRGSEPPHEIIEEAAPSG